MKTSSSANFRPKQLLVENARKGIQNAGILVMGNGKRISFLPLRIPLGAMRIQLRVRPDVAMVLHPCRFITKTTISCLTEGKSV